MKRVIAPCAMAILAAFLGASVSCIGGRQTIRRPSSTEAEGRARLLSYDWTAARANSKWPKDLEDVIPGLPSERIDAALMQDLQGRQTLYLFHGPMVTTVDWATKKIKGTTPERIAEAFPGTFSSGVDAVFAQTLEGTRKLYFIKGHQCVRYDPENGYGDPGYPRQISEEWPGGFDQDIDDVLVPLPDTAFFFKGDQFVRYNLRTKSVDRALIHEGTWNGVWPSGVDAAFFDPREKTAWFIKHRGLRYSTTYPNDNVIFITWDGVRHQEFFDRKSLPRFWHHNADRGVVLGHPALSSGMWIANTSGISYPAYLTMMNGLFNAQCRLNDITPECPRNWIETFPERLIRERDVAREDVAVIASWDRIADAVESVPGKLTINAGLYPFQDPGFESSHDSLNQEQEKRFGKRPERRSERPDDLTWGHAMRYLENHRPKFMYIYLVDTDTYGHQNRYGQYLSQLKRNDIWLDELLSKLASMGDYGATTTVVLTTDHGRGLKTNWQYHGRMPGPKDQESVDRVWAYVIGPHTPHRGAIKHARYSHVNLRPTIEKLLGLQPLLGDERVIREAFDR